MKQNDFIKQENVLTGRGLCVVDIAFIEKVDELRKLSGALIESIIGIHDYLDGDCDYLEPDQDLEAEPDLEPDSDSA